MASPNPRSEVAKMDWRAAGVVVLTGLFLLLFSLVALLAARTLRGQTRPRGEVRTEVHTPPPEVRLEELRT